ncbi:hypothetical protein PLESTB_000713500 [Pleodorina starrii]|uniref:Reverse transcriptase domain-containing protein n=1 Tax=Pleodorina starrii TaxID=330485 RepID=A0A9W6B9L2_9CHLO|nr:hypothetical protein PLESTB_000057600 [Pleodorina starrii]GLC53150.1 hypothetical protein PLESTB_000713500 [Pleodorina starrii]
MPAFGVPRLVLSDTFRAAAPEQRAAPVDRGQGAIMREEPPREPAPVAAQQPGGAPAAAEAAPGPARNAPMRAGRSQVDTRRAREQEDILNAAGGDGLPDVPAEVESSDKEKPQRFMRGRLKEKYAFWKSFVRNPLVLSWILVGFPLLWVVSQPAPFMGRNHGSTREHSQFVSEAIAELVKTGTAIRVEKQPHCVLPLGVAVRADGKKRLILDARYVNEHVVTPGFKYETLAAMQQVLQPNDYAFTIDFKSGYHHVDMHPDFWTFLGFRWDGQFYVFTQLPFGLAPACWAFTKVTRELLTRWRTESHRCSGYLDDSVHAHQQPDALALIQERVFADCAQAGFLVSFEICQPIAQEFTYLGALVNTVTGTMTVPAEKREALMQHISGILNHRDRCQIHAIASVTGHLMSMSYSFGQMSVVMTRRMMQWENEMLRQGYALHHHAPLSDEVVSELSFWRESFLLYDGRRPIWAPPYMHTIKVFTDAAGASSRCTVSFGGWGGWADLPSLPKAAGPWLFDTRGSSSGFLEINAALNVLRSLNKDGLLVNQRILLHTDSQVADSALRKGGSMSDAIQSACFNVFWFCIQNNINLVTTWIPREHNQLADDLSKRDDACDWKLHPEVFEAIGQEWGPFSVDLFASDHNHQMRPYYTFLHTLGTAGVNAFTMQWPRGAWCNPPFTVMSRVLAHAALCRTAMTLIAPVWPGAVWWPSLVENEFIFRPFVRGCWVLPRRPDLFLDRRGVGHLPKWAMVALQLDFSCDCPYAVSVPTLR